MTVLLWNCLSVWCQNDSTYPLRGRSNDVLIDITDIRKANVKLTEHKYCKSIIANKDSIIKFERIRYNYLDSICKSELSKRNYDINRLNKRLDVAKRRNRILSGTAIGSIALFVLTILIK